MYLKYQKIICRFTFFHKKTGVTGPYAFGAGLVTYMLSKEFYVIEHEFHAGVAILIMIMYAAKKFGKPLATYLDGKVDVSNLFQS